MPTIEKTVIDELLAERAGPHVSLYMPTHQGVPGLKKDTIRLRNMLRDAERALRARGADAVLDPARALLRDGGLAAQPGLGLAHFAAPGFQRTHRLSLPFTERLEVAEAFHVRPLLPLTAGAGRFHVLALSKNRLRLLACTRDRAEEVHVADLPESLASALWSDDPERSIQFHGSSAPAGHATPTYHGQGGFKDAEKGRMLRYCRRIDQVLSRHLGAEGTPLVLAGVEHLLAIYREANTYPHLVPAGVTGSPDRRRLEDLRRSAWTIVAPVLRSAVSDACARYALAEGSGRAVDRADDVVRAAHAGRVAVLLLTDEAACWGRVVDGERIHVHDERGPGDVDLLDHAVACTLRHQGEAYALPRTEMPGGLPLAAVLRY